MKNEGPLKNLIKLKDLELHTEAGKVNYGFGLLLVILIILMTGTDWIMQGIALFVGLCKSCGLGENIVENVEQANVTWLIIITVGFFILCFLTLSILDWHKSKVEEKINSNE